METTPTASGAPLRRAALAEARPSPDDLAVEPGPPGPAAARMWSDFRQHRARFLRTLEADSAARRRERSP